MASEVIYKLSISVNGGKNKDANAAEESEATEKVTKPAKNEFQQAVKKVSGYYAATSLVRTAVKSEASLIDVYTGNDYQQRVIEGAIGITESVISTGIAFAINPVAGVAALAAKAISFGTEARRKGVELYTQSLEAGIVRERAGGAFNRSRIKGNY